jgi:hypothetical protein
LPNQLGDPVDFLLTADERREIARQIDCGGLPLGLAACLLVEKLGNRGYPAAVLSVVLARANAETPPHLGRVQRFAVPQAHQLGRPARAEGVEDARQRALQLFTPQRPDGVRLQIREIVQASQRGPCLHNGSVSGGSHRAGHSTPSPQSCLAGRNIAATRPSPAEGSNPPPRSALPAPKAPLKATRALVAVAILAVGRSCHSPLGVRRDRNLRGNPKALYRSAAGLTHESLAERASLSARAISDLEPSRELRGR